MIYQIQYKVNVGEIWFNSFGDSFEIVELTRDQIEIESRDNRNRKLIYSPITFHRHFERAK